jgi:transposase
MPSRKTCSKRTLEADLQAVAAEIEQLTLAAPARERSQPKRRALPANLPRREIRHEPGNTTCACGCQMQRVGEDIAEKLDYEPGVFTVERHSRGKWACKACEKMVQAPVAAHVIDKGIPTAGLLAQVLVAKYADHLPLHRQEGIFARAGLALARSTLAQWVAAVAWRCSRWWMR